MLQNNPKTTPPKLVYQLGGTTYTVGVHFSQTSKETLNDKLERLMLEDCKNNLKNCSNPP